MKTQVNQYHMDIKKKIKMVMKNYLPFQKDSLTIIEKLVKNRLNAKIRFSSSVKNGTYCFKANYKPILKALLSKGTDLTQQ